MALSKVKDFPPAELNKELNGKYSKLDDFDTKNKKNQRIKRGGIKRYTEGLVTCFTFRKV